MSDAANQIDRPKLFRIVCRDCDTLIEFVATQTDGAVAGDVGFTFSDEKERERLLAWPHHGHNCDVLAARIVGNA